MGNVGAALLARFGSELADDRLLILAILLEAGSLAVEQIARRVGIRQAAIQPLLEQLVLAKLATPCDGGANYRAAGQNFDGLLRYLSTVEPAPRRS
jgi:DNA-binding MarR family transcriptional regulator